MNSKTHDVSCQLSYSFRKTERTPCLSWLLIFERMSCLADKGLLYLLRRTCRSCDCFASACRPTACTRHSLLLSAHQKQGRGLTADTLTVTHSPNPRGPARRHCSITDLRYRRYVPPHHSGPPFSYLRQSPQYCQHSSLPQNVTTKCASYNPACAPVQRHMAPWWVVHRDRGRGATTIPRTLDRYGQQRLVDSCCSGGYVPCGPLRGRKL